MTTYIINTPVLTNYGTWSFQGPLTLDEAQALLKDGFVSAIGHSASAEFLSQLLNRNIPTQRIHVSMEPHDSALIFRLLQRLPEGKVLNQQELNQLPYELGVLVRLK